MGAARDAHYEGVCSREGTEKRTATRNPNGEPRCLDCGADLVDYKFYAEGSDVPSRSDADVIAAGPGDPASSAADGTPNAAPFRGQAGSNDIPPPEGGISVPVSEDDQLPTEEVAEALDAQAEAGISPPVISDAVEAAAEEQPKAKSSKK